MSDRRDSVKESRTAASTSNAGASSMTKVLQIDTKMVNPSPKNIASSDNMTLEEIKESESRQAMLEIAQKAIDEKSELMK